MKETISRKSAIAIFITVVIALICATIAMCTTSTVASFNNKSSYFESIGVNDDISADSSVSDIIPAIGKYDAFLADDEEAACLMAMFIYANKSNIYTVQDYRTPEEYKQMYPNNLSQSYYNTELKKRYGIEANGTCSLIAMIIASDALGVNKQLSWDGCYTVEEKNLAMLKELHDISLKYGNEYITENCGTRSSTIPMILQEFYGNHGYNINLSNIVLKDDLRKNVEDKKRLPSIISIHNYLNQYNGEGGGHTVALVGTYKIRLKYKKLKYGISQWGDFNAFIICDGWHNSSGKDIGNTYQLLLFNTDVKNNVYLINLV